MLVAEYDYDTDIAVQRAEERQIAFAEGIERGIEQGIADGSYQTKLETAKLMKHANCELDFIMQMTGLTKEEVEAIN
ncbi:putative transposase/invertase (TIGR01784 family) [Treponema putidum]|nr:putative transposase/invertase (TIGR01784 family) [Treponema putidum]